MFVLVMELLQPVNFKYAILIGLDTDMFLTNHSDDDDDGTNACTLRYLVNSCRRKVF